MTRIAVFPGQGAQIVGMGASLASGYAEARAVFAEVDGALGEGLSRVAFEGPDDALTATRNAQPALLAVSLAALRSLEARTGRSFAELFSHAAGHSLGEYSALVASGALELADAARLLRLRGEAMQGAVPAGQGAMAAILGVGLATVEQLARDAAGEGGVCEIANDNSDGQAVLSGSRAAVERAVALAKERGVKRAMLLQVSAPFHCSLMQGAAATLGSALRATSFKSPSRPIIANVTARPVDDGQALPDLLEQQVTARVRWRETMQTMVELGITQLVEFGSGRVLSGLARRALPAVEVLSVQTAEDVEAVASAVAA